MPAPDDLLAAVAALSERSGHAFHVSGRPVPGTSLYVVYASDHPFPGHYTLQRGALGFRVPSNLPDAAPEDSFFIAPATVKLRAADPVRNSTDLHRAGADPNYLQGVIPVEGSVLVFSWHIWNKGIWNRRKHTLLDHYAHCLRRFELPEHD